MKYIAHKDGEREQTIKEHLIGTATLAGQFAEKFGSKDWGYCGGMLHDIGKYSEEFQKKINEDTNNMVDHATAGAQLCKKINLPVLDYCIAGHHAGLPDYGNTAERSSLCGRYKKKIYNYEAYQEEIKIPEIYTEPFDINTLSESRFFIKYIYKNDLFLPSRCRFFGYRIFYEKWAGGTTIRSKYEHSIEKVRKSHFRLVEK